eukprot:scaffold284629_cov36-Tisochrysis_lutea.AAC.4
MEERNLFPRRDATQHLRARKICYRPRRLLVPLVLDYSLAQRTHRHVVCRQPPPFKFEPLEEQCRRGHCDLVIERPIHASWRLPPPAARDRTTLAIADRRTKAKGGAATLVGHLPDIVATITTMSGTTRGYVVTRIYRLTDSGSRVGRGVPAQKRFASDSAFGDRGQSFRASTAPALGRSPVLGESRA